MADNYFKEEMRTSNLSGVANYIWFLLIAFTLAFLSLAINNFFVLLDNTVVSEALEWYSVQSLFPAALIYNALTLAFFIIALAVRYHSLTFAEMTTNKWYMLRKTGNTAASIVLTKLFAMLAKAVLTYFAGFGFLMLLCFAFGLDLQLSTVFSLLTIGIFQVLAAVSFMMTVSMFVKERKVALMLVLIAVCASGVVSRVTGFYGASTNPVVMSDAVFVFTGATGVYFYLILFVSLILLATAVANAAVNANNYTTYSNVLDEVRYDSKTERTLYGGRRIGVMQMLRPVFKAALVTLTVFGVAGLIALLIFGSAASRSGSLGGNIPMVFNSDTMSGVIERNDCVVFGKVSQNAVLSKGDVIIYVKNGRTQVRVITGPHFGGSYDADYASYPEGYEAQSGKTVVERSEVLGVMRYTDRWMGAWLVWCSTAAGIVFSIVVPAWVLIFDKRLRRNAVLIADKLDFKEYKI